MKITATIESTSSTTTKLQVGGTFALTMRISNISPRTCTRDVGAMPEELMVKQGTKTVWSSDDCPAKDATPHDIRTFHPGDLISANVLWNTFKTVHSCAKGSAAKTGTYQVTGRVGTAHSSPVTFKIVP